MKTMSFISVSEAAEIAGVSCATIRSLCKARVIHYQMNGQLYYPCAEDVNRYANSISKVYAIRQDIENYSKKLAKEREILSKECEETTQNIEDVRIAKFRAKRLSEIMFALLQQYEEFPTEEISATDFELIFKVARGDNFQEAAKVVRLTGERIRQIWPILLRKLASARNEIKFRDEQIASLQHIIQNLEEKEKAKKNVIPIPEAIAKYAEFLIMSLDEVPFSSRTARGLQYAELKTVFELVHCKRNYLRALPNIGNKSIAEIDEWLEKHGLSYDMTFPKEIGISQLKEFILPKNGHNEEDLFDEVK